MQSILTSTSSERQTLFEQANNSLPVAEIPAGTERNKVNDVTEHFYRKYGGLFKNNRSGRVQRPHIHMNKFETVVGQALSQKMNPEEIIQSIEKLIFTLSTKSTKYFLKKGDSSARMEKWLTKTTRFNDCRLGLVITNSDYSQLNALFGLESKEELIRVSPSKALRSAVWLRYCGDTHFSKCPFCKDSISYDSFHCAHDKAHADGGDMSVDNLYPCCENCNLVMGRKTFEEFRRSI